MTRSDREIWSQKLLRFYRVCKSVDPKCFLWKTKTKFLNHSFAKISPLCDAHPLYLIYKLFTGSAVSLFIMSDQSDSQNMPEQPVQMSEGTSPSSSSDEGSRSTPSNLPKAATRQRKKRTSESEDEGYVAEEEATSKKVELKKEHGSRQSTKPGLKVKRPAGRQPMPKARASTNIPEKPAPKESVAAEGKKERKRGRWCKKVDPMAEFEQHSSDEEEEEEVAAPTPKAPKLMGDAIKSGATASKPKEAPKAASKAKTTPKRNTRSIPAAEKNKAPVPDTAEEEEGQVLRKLKPKIPDHNDAHHVAEDMKIKRDPGLRKWREADPYASRRRTAVDYRFHTKEQQDFYETVLLDKKPIVCDMRWVDWEYIKENEEHYPGVYDSFKGCGVADFVGQKLTKWNEELIMQFYSTTHFYPDGRIVWMS